MWSSYVLRVVLVVDHALLDRGATAGGRTVTPAGALRHSFVGNYSTLQNIHYRHVTPLWLSERMQLQLCGAGNAAGVRSAVCRQCGGAAQAVLWPQAAGSPCCSSAAVSSGC